MTSTHTLTGRAFIAVLSLLALGAPLAAQTPAGTSLLQREMDRALARLGATDSFNARAVAAGTPEAAMQMGMRLSQHGIGRLDSASLRVRAEILLNLFGGSDVALCAAWSRGTLDAARASTLIDSMDSLTVSRWADVSAKAIVAEMKATAPVPKPTVDDMMGLFTAIKTVMTPADRTKLDELLPRMGTASDAENCWFIRTVYGNALRLPPAERAKALTVIVGVEAQ